jgi:ABC-type transport system substrate-binding protein
VGLAEAVRSQLKANLGIDVELDVVPAAALAADIAAGTVGGMYLAGVASPLADASGFLEPLFGHGLGSTAAGRATGVADALDELARTTGIAARSAILRTANDAIRSTVPIAPLVHPGTVAVFRSDVADAAISPMGLDRIGSLAPGDRHQVVFVGAVEPAGAWCADQVSLDAYRLCGLVTEGLYGFKPGGVAVEPRLAVRCAPNADATVWTCRLRPETLFHDGMRLDAGDVLASLVAQWDPAGPLRATAPEGAFSTWDALFGPSAGG